MPLSRARMYWDYCTRFTSLLSTCCCTITIVHDAPVNGLEKAKAGLANEGLREKRASGFDFGQVKVEKRRRDCGQRKRQAKARGLNKSYGDSRTLVEVQTVNWREWNTVPQTFVSGTDGYVSAVAFKLYHNLWSLPVAD